jgi:hypothetical protein
LLWRAQDVTFCTRHHGNHVSPGVKVSCSRDSTLTEPALDTLNQEKSNNSQQYFNNLYQF